MKILLLSTTCDSMVQRLLVELSQCGHDVTFELISSNDHALEAAKQCQPELILYPDIEFEWVKGMWARYRCVGIYINGSIDSGFSSLDWAIQQRQAQCAVSAIQLSEDQDLLRQFAVETVALRSTTKCNLYLLDIQEAVVKVTLQTIENLHLPHFVPQQLPIQQVQGLFPPKAEISQADRRIDWEQETTEDILAKIHAADGYPGVADTIRGMDYYLYGASPEGTLRGHPKALIAKRFGAVCRATKDGALWITHLEPKQGDLERTNFKLPAGMVFREKIRDLPEIARSINDIAEETYREIWYEEQEQVGYLHFNFYEGAMNTEQCLRLKDALLDVLQRPTRVLVLLGGEAIWSSGIDLRVIEASVNPAEESWHNINALNDLVLTILTATEKLTLAAIHGHAWAGGVTLAAACDKACMRKGALLNFNYKAMGLFGSEYWTYVLPKRIGYDKALDMMNNCRIIGAKEAALIGLVDAGISGQLSVFEGKVKTMAQFLAQHPKYDQMLRTKIKRRNHDEFVKPLQYYREEEQRSMREGFFESDAIYHLIRKQLVHNKLFPAKECCN